MVHCNIPTFQKLLVFSLRLIPEHTEEVDLNGTRTVLDVAFIFTDPHCLVPLEDLNGQCSGDMGLSTSI